MADKLIIFDTTLRDGEQSPGASMTKDEKLRIARQLERLKVDVIEAGFAASSYGDFEAVKRAFATMAEQGRLVRTYRRWFLQPTSTGENLNLPISLQLTEAWRALGIDAF